MAKPDTKTKTGLFPSFDARRRPRRGPGKTQLNELRVRCIRDGGIRAFIYDGNGKDGTANQATQQLVRNIAADDDEGNPIFFLDKEPDSPIKFLITRNAPPFPVRVANEKTMAKMAKNVESRSASAAEGQAEVDKALGIKAAK